MIHLRCPKCSNSCIHDDENEPWPTCKICDSTMERRSTPGTTATVEKLGQNPFYIDKKNLTPLDPRRTSAMVGHYGVSMLREFWRQRIRGAFEHAIAIDHVVPFTPLK